MRTHTACIWEFPDEMHRLWEDACMESCGKTMSPWYRWPGTSRRWAGLWKWQSLGKREWHEVIPEMMLVQVLQSIHTAFFTKDYWFEMILILGWLSVIFALKVYSFFFFFEDFDLDSYRCSFTDAYNHLEWLESNHAWCKRIAMIICGNLFHLLS